MPLFNQSKFYATFVEGLIMDSAGSRALVKKDEKKQESVFKEKNVSIFDRLPQPLKRHTLSFLVGNDIERYKRASVFGPSLNGSLEGSFFAECKASLVASAATKAVQNLAHRIKVNETLVFMQSNPNIFQSLPFPIEITDRRGQPIKRDSIMKVLVALDEFDVTKVKADAKAEVKPHGLIPTVFSLFKEDNARNNQIKNLLQQQLKETSGPQHERASKERRDRYLREIEILIHNVIKCADVSNDWNAGPFDDLFNLGLIQNFINNAFKPDPEDKGEWGVVWDCWQLYLDHIAQLESYVNGDKAKDKSRPNLGGWSRKAYLVAATVYMAFMRCSQFCHLEVFAKGTSNVDDGVVPVRFDCSKGLPAILVGIGSTHCFDFFDGEKLAAGGIVCRRGRWQWPFADAGLTGFCQTKTSALHSLCGPSHTPRAAV